MKCGVWRAKFRGCEEIAKCRRCRGRVVALIGPFAVCRRHVLFAEKVAGAAA